MGVLTLRTDNEIAELGLYDDKNQVAYLTWLGHRQLAETVHRKIDELLRAGNSSLAGLTGVVVYQGPGSFTGLRIGITVANALAASYSIPVVGRQTDDWLQIGLHDIMQGLDDKIVIPEYGAPVHITQQKK